MNPLQFSQLAFSCVFRLPNPLEFSGCRFSNSCYSTQGSLNGHSTNFKHVSAFYDVVLNDCHADQVLSEKSGVTWFNRHPTFVNNIQAIQNIVLDGISSNTCCSQSGSVTAKKGKIIQISAAGILDLDKMMAYHAACCDAADLSRSTITLLDAFDNVRLTASHVYTLKLTISQNQGVIELNERSTIQNILIIPGFEPEDQLPHFEITLSGNGRFAPPIYSYKCVLSVLNYLN